VSRDLGGDLRIFVPLRSLPVALLWGGLSLSAMGDQLYAVALTWIAVRVLGSDAGYLSALQALIVFLAVLGIGRWADRWNPHRGMIGADLCRAAILIGIVTLWLAKGAPSVAALVAAIMVLAIGEAVFDPALQSVLPSLIDDKRLLPAANGLLDATDRSARLVGPDLIAILAGTIPVVHFLSLDALSFLASAAALLLITRLHGRKSDTRRIGREGIWSGVRRGVLAMNSHPLLGYVLKTSGLLNGAWYAVFFLSLPLMIARRGVEGLGGSSLGAFGLVISAYGCANLAATLIFGGQPLSLRPQIQIFAGNLLVGGGIVLMGVTSFLPTEWLLPGLMATAALSAVGGPMKDISVAVLRQTRVQRADLPAAMRAYMAVNSAGTLLAMLLVPTALILAGTVSVIIVCGATIIGVGFVGLIRYVAWSEAGPVRTA
jgi:MFS transporter, DHA3 family, macrolide efflux protein